MLDLLFKALQVHSVLPMPPSLTVYICKHDVRPGRKDVGKDVALLLADSWYLSFSFHNTRGLFLARLLRRGQVCLHSLVIDALLKCDISNLEPFVLQVLSDSSAVEEVADSNGLGHTHC